MTLLLIDGKNSLYRFGFAMQKLRSGDGELTGAVHGFLQMLLRLKKKYPDGRFIIAWDGRGYRTGWRAQIYPEYKSNRGGEKPKAVEEIVGALHSQEATIKKICNLIGLTQTALDEVEADDIIGVLAARYAKEHQTVIYSSDKDFIQLMPLGVTVIRDVATFKGPQLKRMMPETFETVDKLFRCTPDKVLKVRAICGDSSDNIPGAIKGVGGVGAVKAIIAGADPANEQCKVGKAWAKEAWATVHRNYRIMRILQSTSDFELTLQQRRALEHEVARIHAHLVGNVKLVRKETDLRALLDLLASLDLKEAIESRHELWKLNYA